MGRKQDKPKIEEGQKVYFPEPGYSYTTSMSRGKVMAIKGDVAIVRHEKHSTYRYEEVNIENLMPYGRKFKFNMKALKLSTPAIVTGVVLILGLMIFGWFTSNYNSLVSAKADVDNSWAKVETQYQRRLDLIDNVVASVQGAQGQEIAVFGKIAESRTAYNNASTTDEKAAAASAMETNIAVLPRLQEAYPELKSNEQVTKLINELSGTENTISTVRDVYNDKVTSYNVAITKFPTSLFANMFDFEKAKLFKADAGASKAPKVKF